MTKPATSAAEPHAVVELVPLDKIAESPSNPRRTFTGIEDLAESVKQHGILQPILVRPMKGIGANLYMVVFGARRYRAAKIAGLDAIPSMVRELADTDALEMQIVENSKREDVHPLEEAEGYEQLLHAKDREYDVEEIAAKVGKSKGYVYGRMKLLALCKELREAFYAGKFTASSALLVARVTDHGTQRAILKELKDRYRGDGEGTYGAHDVSWIVQRHMCKLAEAPFSKDDADLVPGAGPCSLCSKRSGAQPELFADVAKQNGDLCIDPVCFAKKKDAAWEKRAVEAQAKGLKVFEGKAGEKVLHGNDHVRLDQTYYQDPKYRTLKQLIGKVAKDRVVLARDEQGEVRELVPKNELKKLLKEAGHNFKAERAASSPGRLRSHGESAKEKDARAIREAVGPAIAGAFVEKLKTKKPDLSIWRFAVERNAIEVAERVFERRLGEEKARVRKACLAHIAQLDEEQLRALMIECALEDVLYYESTYGDGKKVRAAVLRWAGIDPKKVEAEVKAERAAAAQEKARPIKWTEKKDGDAIGKAARGRVYTIRIGKTPLFEGGKGFSWSVNSCGVGAAGAGPFKTIDEAKRDAEAGEAARLGGTSPAKKKEARR